MNLHDKHINLCISYLYINIIISHLEYFMVLLFGLGEIMFGFLFFIFYS